MKNKIMKNFLLYLLLLGTIPYVNASECSEITTMIVPMNKDTYYLILTEHNGKRLNQLVFNQTSGVISGGPRTLQLAPGLHEFKAFAGKSAYTRGATITAKYGESSSQFVGGDMYSTLHGEFYFSIEVAAGTKYRLIAQKNHPETTIANKTYRAEILKISPIECQVASLDHIYKPLMSDQLLVNTSVIPDELKFEFDQIMLEISDFYRKQNIKSGSVNIHRQRTSDTTFGLSGNMTELGDDSGLQVARVDENSSAASIGLHVNDIILALNGENISGENLSVLSAKFTQLDYQQKYTLTVQRDNKVLELIDTYQPSLLPGFNLSIDLSSLEPIEEWLVNIGRRTSNVFPRLDLHALSRLDLHERSNSRPKFMTKHTRSSNRPTKSK